MRILTDRTPPKRIPRVIFRQQSEHVSSQTDAVGRSSLELGVGPTATLTRRQFILALRRVVIVAKEQKWTGLAIDFRALRSLVKEVPEVELAELLAVNFLLADYAFEHYKTEPDKGFPHVKTVYLMNADTSRVRNGLRRGKIIGEETNQARHIATMPASEMTPALLARHARQTFRKLPVRVTIWNEREIERQGMAGVIAVGKGSVSKPRFIILEYRGDKRGALPTVLIGKGVTFDAGGINLKPSTAILGMNMDMSGGASVIHTLAACARLKLKQNIIALIPAVENMISGESYRPGDIIRTLSGKTVEVQDTDAEGRIILADTLTWAAKYHPRLVIDVATLTGSAMVALGERSSAIFTEDEALETKLRHIGLAVGDPVWPLPLWDEYLDDIKGTYADIANVGNTKWGGAITAAMFLKQFVTYPWAHIDIAPRMMTISGEHLAKGSVGAGVQLLVRFLAGSGT
ncbi:MAG: leucyl aminopeptidase family protein [Candidatus Moraniibacteriota bacterium]